MKRGGVAESYLDTLAVRVQCIRMGKRGRGWRRFLVFAELTKSKKGVEYVALFSYFSFKGKPLLLAVMNIRSQLLAWLRVIFAEGPRQVINALTLYSFLQAKLIPTGANGASGGRSPFQQFWFNFSVMFNTNQKEGIVLLGMLWVLVIWVISALNLIIACILYLLFLWHWVPSSDGSLSAYCKRKIDSRVNTIVGAKIQKAREKEETKRQLEEAKALKAGERPPPVKREPTLPLLGDMNEKADDSMSTLTRNTSQATLPTYSSRPPTRNGSDPPGLQRQPTLPELMGSATGAPLSRAGTQASYASNAPLTTNAGAMAFGTPSRSQTPHIPSMMGGNERPPPGRSYTNGSAAGGFAYGPNSRPSTANSNRAPGPPPMNGPGRRTPGPPNYNPMDRRTPGPQQGRQSPYAPPPVDDYGRRTPGPPPSGRSTPNPSRQQTPNPPPFGSEENFPFPSRTPRSESPYRPPPSSNNGYVAFTPTNPKPLPLQSQPQQPLPYPPGRAPHRNLTEPSATSQGPPASYFPPAPTARAGTAPPQSSYRSEGAYDSIYDAYGSADELEAQKPAQRMPPPRRANTAGPHEWEGGTGQRGYGAGFL